MDATDNLPWVIILLAVDHKIDHGYPKLLCIYQLNMEHNTVEIQRKTVIGKLQSIYITDSEVNNIFWTTDGTTTPNRPAELPYMSSEWSFHPEHNFNRDSIVLEDAHILLEANDGLVPYLKENTTTSSPSHLQMWEEQTSVKWIS